MVRAAAALFCGGCRLGGCRQPPLFLLLLASSNSLVLAAAGMKWVGCRRGLQWLPRRGGSHCTKLVWARGRERATTRRTPRHPGAPASAAGLPPVGPCPICARAGEARPARPLPAPKSTKRTKLVRLLPTIAPNSEVRNRRPRPVQTCRKVFSRRPFPNPTFNALALR